jgi:hypothetical protein
MLFAEGIEAGTERSMSEMKMNEPPENAPGGSFAQASDDVPLTPSGLPCRNTNKAQAMPIQSSQLIG